MHHPSIKIQTIKHGLEHLSGNSAEECVSSQSLERALLKGNKFTDTEGREQIGKAQNVEGRNS